MDSSEAFDPGSEPLRNHRHERFARLRALDLPSLLAARGAGYELMTAGNAAKLDRNRKIRARITWLTRQEEEVLREKRRMLEERQWLIHDADIGDFYEIVEEVVEDEQRNPLRDAAGKPVMRRFQRLKLFDEMSREQRLCVEGITWTERGKPNLKLYSKSEANKELRKLLGLDKPTKISETDPEGKPLPSLADRARALAVFLVRTQLAAVESETAIQGNKEEARPAVNQHLDLERGR
jgi:hypothetical protein